MSRTASRSGRRVPARWWGRLGNAVSALWWLAALAWQPLAGTEFQAPPGTVVSKTNGLLATGATLLSLKPTLLVDTAWAYTGTNRSALIVYLGDGTDTNSRKLVFMPVTVYPPSSWYERWDGNDGQVLQVTWAEYLALGGQQMDVYGSQFARWIGATWVDGMFGFYRPCFCYRLIENFPMGYSYENINQYLISHRTQQMSELYCAQLETFCSLIPGVNTAVVGTKYPLFSREVLSAVINDGATLIPGAIVLKSGTISLLYVKGTFVAAELGMGAYDFTQAENNQDRLMALLGIAGGMVDLSDTIRAAKCGTNLQRPAKGVQEQRMYDNLLGNQEKAALGSVNPTTGLPTGKIDDFVVGVTKCSSGSGLNLPKRNPPTDDVRTYLQNYVSNLTDANLKANILASDEWAQIMNTTYSPMKFAPSDYTPIVVNGNTFTFNDYYAGCLLEWASPSRSIYINPNWPDEMILVTAFHETTHAWRYATPSGRAREKMVCKSTAFNNFSNFWSDNLNGIAEDEAFAQMGSAHFIERLQGWQPNIFTNPALLPTEVIDIINKKVVPGERRMQNIQSYLLGTTSGYAPDLKNQARTIYNNLMAYCKKNSNWPNGPATPLERFLTFDKGYYYDPLIQPP